MCILKVHKLFVRQERVKQSGLGAGRHADTTAPQAAANCARTLKPKAEGTCCVCGQSRCRSKPVWEAAETHTTRPDAVSLMPDGTN